MKITPLDITQQQFRRALRGLNEREVKDFLQLVASEMEALVHENHGLKDRLAKVESELDEMRGRERVLKETMITAQRITEDIRNAAKKEADIIVAQAEIQADNILRNGHNRLIEILDEINELKTQRARLAGELRGVIESHAKLLDAVMTRDEEKARIEDKLHVMGADRGGQGG